MWHQAKPVQQKLDVSSTSGHQGLGAGRKSGDTRSGCKWVFARTANLTFPSCPFSCPRTWGQPGPLLPERRRPDAIERCALGFDGARAGDAGSKPPLRRVAEKGWTSTLRARPFKGKPLLPNNSAGSQTKKDGRTLGWAWAWHQEDN